MKKVILTIAAVAFTVVAANAQSARVEVGIMSAGFKTFAQNNSTKKSDLEKKVNAKSSEIFHMSAIWSRRT